MRADLAGLAQHTERMCSHPYKIYNANINTRMADRKEGKKYRQLPSGNYCRRDEVNAWISQMPSRVYGERRMWNMPNGIWWQAEDEFLMKQITIKPWTPTELAGKRGNISWNFLIRKINSKWYVWVCAQRWYDFMRTYFHCSLTHTIWNGIDNNINSNNNARM